jgi:hypothetical protein
VRDAQFLLIGSGLYHNDLHWSVIHGDLHYNNILMNKSGNIGLLNFKFFTYNGLEGNGVEDA